MSTNIKLRTKNLTDKHSDKDAERLASILDLATAENDTPEHHLSYITNVKSKTYISDLWNQITKETSYIDGGGTSPLLSIPEYALPQNNYFAIQARWNGIVEEILEQSFIAKLIDFTSSVGYEELAEIDFEDIHKDDRELIELGAEFYWHIGRSSVPYYSTQTISIIRFKRIPHISEAEVMLAKEKAQTIRNTFFENKKR